MAYFKAKIWTSDIATTKQELYPVYCRYPLDHSSVCSLELNGGHGPLLLANVDTGMRLWRMTVMSGLSVLSHRGQNFRRVNTKLSADMSNTASANIAACTTLRIWTGCTQKSVTSSGRYLPYVTRYRRPTKNVMLQGCTDFPMMYKPNWQHFYN